MSRIPTSFTLQGTVIHVSTLTTAPLRACRLFSHLCIIFTLRNFFLGLRWPYTGQSLLQHKIHGKLVRVAFSRTLRYIMYNWLLLFTPAQTKMFWDIFILKESRPHLYCETEIPFSFCLIILMLILVMDILTSLFMLLTINSMLTWIDVQLKILIGAHRIRPKGTCYSLVKSFNFWWVSMWQTWNIRLSE